MTCVRFGPDLDASARRGRHAWRHLDRRPKALRKSAVLLAEVGQCLLRGRGIES